MSCLACRRVPATAGVLCETCSEALAGPELAPQQIEVLTARQTAAGLVDQWGHVHLLDRETAIGRSLAEHKIVILEPSVSRQHAELVLGTSWSVLDLGSTCGTFVNERRTEGRVDVEDRDRIRFGDVSFYFLAGAPPQPPRPQRYEIPTTRVAAKQTGQIRATQRAVTVTLQAPSGGGGGLLVIRGRQIQLTQPQYELVATLVRRMQEEVDKDPEERGFVHVTELRKLSLEVPDPSEDHVRQLVHRVRRALVRAELGDLIEVRRGVGYRLRIVPRLVE